jgi:hypothetical protein
MKKHLTSLAAFCLLTGILLLSGCKKDHFSPSPNEIASLCKIKKMLVPFYPGGPLDTLTFTYNSAGQLVSATRPNPATGAPNYLFRYDQRGRLTDFIGAYIQPNGAEFWHTYYYANAKSQYPFVDTSYIFTSDITTRPPVNYYTRSATAFTYDAKGRISGTTTDNGVDPPSTMSYTYNPDGSQPGVLYDDKVNFILTDKTLMFISRSYSPHNPFTAQAYNPYGLPTIIDFTGSSNVLHFLMTDLSYAVLEYDCSCQAPAGNIVK